jgi:hypothetical protein
MPATQAVWQMPPAQQGCPVAPHAVQVPLEPQTVAPMHQKPGPASAGLLPGQQGWPLDPHATQLEPEHVVKGAVQVAAGPVPQQGDPSVPHAPPEQPPPAAHMPRPPGHMVPVATQVPVTQHPPPVQSFPSQQGWFVPPQLAHTPLRPHAFPAALQKAAANRGPASPTPASPAAASPAPASPAAATGGSPAQQLCELAPQLPHDSLVLELHVPRDPPHVVPPFTQVPPAQQ